MKNKITIFLMMILINIATFSRYLPSTVKEDIEIEKLKEQMSLIKSKIKVLEEIKEKKKDAKYKDIKIGLTLSGGGAKGLAHIGVLKVLEKLGIKPDYITGTSIGAIVGGLYSVGYTPDEIEEILTDKKWISFVQGGFVSDEIPLEKRIINKKYMVSVRFDNKFNFSFPQGIGSTQSIYFELKKLLEKKVNTQDFDKLPIPLRVIATDLNTGKAKAFSHGDLAKTITASIAIPTIFEPVEIDSRLYVDGLVSRNFPVIDAYNMGATIVIGSDVGNELKEKKDYNIISVLNQLVAIQSAQGSKEQEKLATILITPDVYNDSATDFENSKKFVKLGVKAANEKITLLEKISKYSNKRVKQPKIEKKFKGNVYIKNIKFTGDVSPKNQDIIRNILGNLNGQTVTYQEVEKSVAKLYGMDFIKNIYYSIDDEDLILNVKTNPSNLMGISVNYLTGYGTVFNMGTRISNLGTIGNNSLLNVKLGDYTGVKLSNFIYYGHSNKIGIFINGSYNENPLFIYKDNKKISDSLVQTALFEAGILTQYDNNMTLSYGIDYRHNKVRQKTGSFAEKDINSEQSYNSAFLRLGYDSVISTNNHNNYGIKSIFEYDLENNFSKSKSNIYGPSYIFDGYHKFFNKLTFNYGFTGGFYNKNREKSKERYFKIGGIKNNFSEREFSFYGLNYGQKIVDKFFIAKLGLDYEFYPNTYIGATYNVGSFHELGDKNNIFEEYNRGVGVTLTYESILGPLQFTVTRNKKGKYLSQIGIGYIFE